MEMIGIVLCSLVFIFGLFFTLPPTKKLLTPLFFHSFHQNPPQPLIINSHKQLTKPTTSFNKTPTTHHELRDVFATFDKNSDGYITKRELSESLENIGISAGEKDVDDMVEKVDSNGDGLIDFGEFCQLFESKPAEDCDLKEAFDVFDGNKDGVITVDELGLVLSSLGFSEGGKIDDCKEMIRKVDVDGDGTVNFDEFKSMMNSGLIGRPLLIKTLL